MKKRNIVIIFLSSILIILCVLAIINYIILPPKVSKNAQRYTFNQNNMLKLKSITVDGNMVIYEFGSSNKYFSKEYVEENIKEYERYGNTPFLQPYFVEGYQAIVDSIYTAENYYICSSITSNFLVVYLDENKQTNSIAFSFIGNGDRKEAYDYMQITVNSSYENPRISMSLDYTWDDLSVVNSQQYDSNMKKWEDIITRKYPYSEYR